MTRIALYPAVFRCDICQATTETNPKRGWTPIKPYALPPKPIQHRCPDCERKARSGEGPVGV